MDLLELCIVAGVLTTLSLMIWRSVGRSPLGRLLAAGALRQLRQLKGGRSYTRGGAVAGELLQAPISEKAVIGYRIVVEQRVANLWTPLMDHSELKDFELADEGFFARVLSDHALMLLTTPMEARGRGRLPDRVRELLIRYSQYIPEPDPMALYRWTEFSIQEGEELFVVGDCALSLSDAGRTSALNGPAYRGAPTMPQLRGTPSAWLLVLDRSRDDLRSFLEGSAQHGRYLPPELRRGG